MLFYMVSLVCTVMPCAHLISSEGTIGSSPAQYVYNDDPGILSYGGGSESLSGNNVSFQKTARAFQSTGKNKFLVNLLSKPALDELAQGTLKGLPNFVESSNPVVSINDGRLRGFTMQTITSRPFFAFQSIPFAQPPVGPLRFQAPRKNFPWGGVRDAINPSPECIQADYIKQYLVHGQEDCLYLNVYTPKLPSLHNQRKLPVMVFIHGGGFFFGSSTIYGPNYLLDQDIVLVSMNYRLGALGFLATLDEASSANNGLKDQALALRWIQDNIEAFGGDRNSVTIFGESAGASSVHFHFLSPLSRGLFHRGISQSGCATCFWSIDEKASDTARRFGGMLNCTGSSPEIISCLRTKDAATIASTHLYFLEWLMYPVVVFGPVVEPNNTVGAFLTMTPEETYRENKAANVPWISGFNKDEGAINIAALFLDNNTIPQLNNDWDKYGPVFLDMKNADVGTVNKVREYYLGDKEISFQNRKLVVDMFGDRYSVVCGLKAMRYHSMYTDQPVYAYHLSYSGKYSIVQMLGQNPQDWGVSHLDDLVYQFNNTGYYPELQNGEEEHTFAKQMNSIWSNFATHGKPYVSNGGELKDIWMPIEQSDDLSSPLHFLDLNLEQKMIKDPFAERDKFWRDLGLEE